MKQYTILWLALHFSFYGCEKKEHETTPPSPKLRVSYLITGSVLDDYYQQPIKNARIKIAEGRSYAFGLVNSTYYYEYSPNPDGTFQVSYHPDEHTYSVSMWFECDSILRDTGLAYNQIYDDSLFNYFRPFGSGFTGMRSEFFITPADPFHIEKHIRMQTISYLTLYLTNAGGEDLEEVRFVSPGGKMLGLLNKNDLSNLKFFHDHKVTLMIRGGMGPYIDIHVVHKNQTASVIRNNVTVRPFTLSSLHVDLK